MVKKRILVLGGGFAGVDCTRKLERYFQSNYDVEITLVSDDNFLLFTPMLPQVASGTIMPRHIVMPLRSLCENARIYESAVRDIDPIGKHVTLEGTPEKRGVRIHYDYLIIALGSETNFFGLKNVEKHSFTMKTLADALSLRNRIIDMLEQAENEINEEIKRRLLTFVVVGGGFAGIETAGEHAAKGMELQRKFNLPTLKQLMQHGTNIGLKFYGTFTFGGEGSTDDCDKKTLDLIRELLDRELLWRFQLSISTPQPGTPFINHKKEQGHLKDVDWKHFDGGNHVVVNRPEYPAEKIMENFREAEKLYELGFNHRYKKTAQDNFKSVKLRQDGEILLFRSSRMKQINDVVNSLHDQFKKDVTVLAQPSVEPELRKNPHVSLSVGVSSFDC